jgi:ABC-type anion transport system duplicated permease subunit
MKKAAEESRTSSYQSFKTVPNTFLEMPLKYFKIINKPETLKVEMHEITIIIFSEIIFLNIFYR